MRIQAAAILTGLALAVSACESQADKTAEIQADRLEEAAANTSNEAMETRLNAQADMIEQQAGNVDGGATTSNTPNTSPSMMPMNPEAR